MMTRAAAGGGLAHVRGIARGRRSRIARAAGQVALSLGVGAGILLTATPALALATPTPSTSTSTDQSSPATGPPTATPTAPASAPLTTCGIAGTVSVDGRTVDLTGCSGRFGLAIPPLQVTTGQTLTVTLPLPGTVSDISSSTTVLERDGSSAGKVTFTAVRAGAATVSGDTQFCLAEGSGVRRCDLFQVEVSPAPSSLSMTISRPSGPARTTVEIRAEGCNDPNGHNHAVSFNNGNADATNPTDLYTVSNTKLSGTTLTASFTLPASVKPGASTFSVQCSDSTVQAAFTVTAKSQVTLVPSGGAATGGGSTATIEHSGVLALGVFALLAGVGAVARWRRLGRRA